MKLILFSMAFILPPSSFILTPDALPHGRASVSFYSQELAAVNDQNSARDVSRALGAEEGDCVRNVFRLAHSTERRLPHGLLSYLLRQALDERRAYEAGRDGVDVDAISAQLRGGRARE